MSSALRNGGTNYPKALLLVSQLGRESASILTGSFGRWVLPQTTGSQLLNPRSGRYLLLA
jgi:hypothetical protein